VDGIIYLEYDILNMIRKLKNIILYFMVYLKYLFVYQLNKNKLRTKENRKIDVVYCWANFNDLNWLNKREVTREKYCGYKEAIILTINIVMNELKYSIRSVEKYLEGLNNIYIITDNQIPDFLDLNNSRIKIIDHKDIFKKSACLPTYNCTSLESCIHNIPGLNEYFLYFNDDCYLNCDLNFDDFFTKKGVITLLGRKIIDKNYVSKSDTHQQNIRNTDIMLDDKYTKETRLVLMHRPQPMIRSLQRKYEYDNSLEFEKARNIHIRQFYGIVSDVSLHNYFFGYASYYDGLSLLKPIIGEKDMYYWTNNLSANKYMINTLNRRKPKMFCIQEIREIKLTDEVCNQFNNEFEKLFPTKSSFEI